MIRAGIDPGSAKVGLSILDGDASPLRLVLARTLEVGRMVERAKPKIVKRDGLPDQVITHRRSVTQDDVDALADGLVSTIVEHGAGRVVVEWVDTAHMDGGDAAKTSNIATQLLRTKWIAVTLCERLKSRGIDVVTVLASTWRGKVARNASLPGRGRALAPILAEHVQGWPEQSDEHERDAAGLVLWDVLPEPEGRRRSSGMRPGSNAARLAEERKRRADAGCVCGPRHRRTCALFVAVVGAARKSRPCGCAGPNHRKTCALFVPKKRGPLTKVKPCGCKARHLATCPESNSKLAALIWRSQ